MAMIFTCSFERLRSYEHQPKDRKNVSQTNQNLWYVRLQCDRKYPNMVRKKTQFVNNSEEDVMYFQIVLVLKAHRRN